ncbi:hypothetical protein BH10BAC2_BH10BAC2_41870 [soil metagenome]
MNEPGKNIVQQLFGESSLDEVSPKTIEQIVSRYPYFGPAQFLLAKKLNGTNGNEAQLQKAALYFSNPYWLNYLLTEELVKEEVIATINEYTIEAPVEIVATEQEPTIEDTIAEPVAVSTETEDQLQEDLAAETVIVEIPTIIEDTGTNEAITAAEEIITTQASAIAEATDPETIEDIIEEEEEYLPTAEEDETDPQLLRLSSIIEQHLADFKKPVDEGQELPVKANPYHTVDYFASQGIKADGSDKLTHRVKKFTDWLKQMKAPNTPPTDLGTDAETEQMIETIAQTSNETKDIVTEAMAEVLVKQGKTQKALQLYKKLSFLNPAKSTYFAAKIDELNNK